MKYNMTLSELQEATVNIAAFCISIVFIAMTVLVVIWLLLIIPMIFLLIFEVDFNKDAVVGYIRYSVDAIPLVLFLLSFVFVPALIISLILGGLKYAQDN